jgi:hypothetical protein
MTEEQAIRLAGTKFWEDMTHEQRAKFQMREDRLCMPFGVFHEAVEKTLGRPVFTHEFGLNRDGLMRELYDGAEPPTMDEILDMIPAEKRIVLTLDV